MLGTCVRATRWIVDYDESDAAIASQTITLVFLLFWVPRSTTVILTLISVVGDPILPVSSNCRITLIQRSSDSSIRPTFLFESLTSAGKVHESFGKALLQPAKEILFEMQQRV
ncbi:hypothetical protein TNCV_2467381 [Trichonephila clavipes]|nr:hypothetical protein TNCV_2467381 [Trichonephila clavipes]